VRSATITGRGSGFGPVPVGLAVRLESSEVFVGIVKRGSLVENDRKVCNFLHRGETDAPLHLFANLIFAVTKILDAVGTDKSDSMETRRQIKRLAAFVFVMIAQIAGPIHLKGRHRIAILFFVFVGTVRFFRLSVKVINAAAPRILRNEQLQHLVLTDGAEDVEKGDAFGNFAGVTEVLPNCNFLDPTANVLPLVTVPLVLEQPVLLELDSHD
jgi:hypothetical protein